MSSVADRGRQASVAWTWPVALACVFTALAFAGCSGAPADTNASSAEDPNDSPLAVRVPPVHHGSSAVFERKGGHDVSVEVASEPATVVTGNGSRSTAVLAAFVNEETDSPPDYVQAIDPENGRLLRTVNRCLYLEDSSRTCEDGWAYARFDVWGNPGLFGTSPFAEATLVGPTSMQLPTNPPSSLQYVPGEGPTAATKAVTIRPENASESSNPFYGGPSRGALLLDGESPLPRRVETGDEAFRRINASPAQENPVALDRSAPPSSAEGALRDPLLPANDFLRPGLPFGEPVPHSIFPPEEALSWVKETDDYQAFERDHPNASLTKGKLVLPHTDKDNAGTTKDWRQKWVFVFADPGTRDGWKISVLREHERIQGKRYENSTEIVESKERDKPVGVYPTPDRSTRGLTLDSLARTLPNETEFGKTHSLTWTLFPQERPGVGASHLVGVVGFTGGNDEALSISRGPFLSVSVEQGTLRSISVPAEDLGHVDRNGLGWEWPG